MHYGSKNSKVKSVKVGHCRTATGSAGMKRVFSGSKAGRGNRPTGVGKKVGGRNAPGKR